MAKCNQLNPNVLSTV